MSGASPAEWLAARGGFQGFVGGNAVFTTQTQAWRPASGQQSKQQQAPDLAQTDGTWWYAINMRSGAETTQPTGFLCSFVPVRTPHAGAFLPPGVG